MNTEIRALSTRFVHLFLFRCPNCDDPLTVAMTAAERNMEETDSRPFVLRCSCGWKGEMIGLAAKRHWVEAWD